MSETTTATPNVADVEEAMRDVVDPELGINVVDLGLVYGITVDAQKHAVLDMTLTSAACPLTDVIEDQTAAGARGPGRVLPRQLGLDAAVGPRQDHRRRPRAAARPRVQPLSSHQQGSHQQGTPEQGGARPRVVEVAPERLDGWLERFAANNADSESPQRITAREEFTHDPLGVLLIRRGGYAVGLARGAAFAESKVGKRHVQSRTAAGGWSQQRFARRRGNQADELVRAVTEHTLRILPRGIPARHGRRRRQGAGARGPGRPAPGPPRRTAASRALRPAGPAACASSRRLSSAAGRFAVTIED